MAHKLADETLADILAYSLDVADEDFASLEELSKAPFVNRQTSSSAALAVCKRWMRIGTPLLYNTAIMRSTAQADALARALKANRPFASYVKKLRIEGGFGGSVRKILEMATEVTDIWLMLNYTSDEKAKPMCAALEKMTNVQRLVLYSGVSRMPNNANTRLVVSTVLNCLKYWTSLRVVHATTRPSIIDEGLRSALLRADQVEELCFPDACFQLASFVRESPAHIKRIRVGWADPCVDGFFLPHAYGQQDSSRLEPAHMAKIVFAAPVKAARVSPPENPFYEPMKNAPSGVRSKIWSRVFELLIADCPRLSWYEFPYRPVKQCLLVSHEFRDVMIEVACTEASLRGFRSAESFTLLLKQRPHLALLVQDVRFNVSRHVPWLGPPDAERCFDLVKALMPKFVNIRSFVMIWQDYPLDLKQFAACLAPVSETLRELKVHLRQARAEYQYYSNTVPPPFEFALPAFASLRTLSLMFDTGSAAHLQPPPPHALNELESLVLSGAGCAEFLTMTRPLRLESLRILDVARVSAHGTALSDFCTTHGHKLTSLTLDETRVQELLGHCPNIEYLTYPDAGQPIQDPPVAANFRLRPPIPFLKLKEISCPRIESASSGPGDKLRVATVVYGWTKFFDFLLDARKTQFPALQVVRLGNHSEKWPTTERQIAKSPLPGWAEKLLSKDIRLVDAQGVGWTPRLKTQRKSKLP